MSMSRMFSIKLGVKIDSGDHRIYIYNVRPPFAAKLVYKSNDPMVFGIYNELVSGAYKPTYNWGGLTL
jgi:hypothetical protein